MTLDVSKLPVLPNSRPATLDDLRFSDNWRHYSYLKQLMYSGSPLQIVMGNSLKVPTATISLPQNTVQSYPETATIYLIPEMEQLILHYLLYGKSDCFPKYPNHLSYKYEGDYNLFHMKKERSRGVTRAKKAVKCGKDGYEYYAQYPYGRIEYGFYPFSPEYMILLFDNIKNE